MSVVDSESASSREEVFRVEYDKFVFRVAEEWQLSLYLLSSGQSGA